MHIDVLYIWIFILANRTNAFDFHSDYEIARLVSRISGELDSLISSLAMERIVGSRTHNLARELIIDLLIDAGLTVRRHEFVRSTPGFGMINFTNIMGISNPKARSFNAIACHYDTKFTLKEINLGIVDSLVSCVVILHLIHSFKDEILKIPNNRPALLVLFLDGNEPTVNGLTNTDPLYGSTALARMMQTEKFRGRPIADSIKLITVLSLIGYAPLAFKLRYRQTAGEYEKLMKAEHRLLDLDQLDNSAKPYFSSTYAPTNHVDDHLPFINIGIPVMYLLPDILSQYRHTQNDTWSKIDKSSVKDFVRILALYLAMSHELTTPSIYEVNDTFRQESKSKTIRKIKHVHPVIIMGGMGF